MSNRNVVAQYTPFVPSFCRAAYPVPRSRSSTRSSRELGDYGRDPSARRRIRAAGVMEDGGAAAAAGGCRGAGEVQQDVRPR
jgi:hypothetical protein